MNAYDPFVSPAEIDFIETVSIHTEEACAAAQGLWIPLVLDWMTHVYPNEEKKWGGMDMEMESGG